MGRFLAFFDANVIVIFNDLLYSVESLSMMQRDPDDVNPARTLADFLYDLGGIALDRVRMRPLPGTATISDLENTKYCELVDGTLIEKATGLHESLLAGCILGWMHPFLKSRKLGFVVGTGGTMEILPGLVRVPDVAFVSWARTPNGQIPHEDVPTIVPDLVVEIIKRGNTGREMTRKRREYITAGVQRVWMVDRFNRTVSVYSSETECRTLTESDTLDGEDILPGFKLSIRDIFGELERHG
jgi:Uma2 family endonuclease